MHLDPALISWDYRWIAMKFSLSNVAWETLNHQLRRDNLFTTFRFSSHFQFLRPNQLQTSSVINWLNLFVALISLFNKFGCRFWLWLACLKITMETELSLIFSWTFFINIIRFLTQQQVQFSNFKSSLTSNFDSQIVKTKTTKNFMKPLQIRFDCFE